MLERQVSKATLQCIPASHAAGHGDGVHPYRIELVDVMFVQVFDGERFGVQPLELSP